MFKQGRIDPHLVLLSFEKYIKHLLSAGK